MEPFEEFCRLFHRQKKDVESFTLAFVYHPNEQKLSLKYPNGEREQQRTNAQFAELVKWFKDVFPPQTKPVKLTFKVRTEHVYISFHYGNEGSKVKFDYPFGGPKVLCLDFREAGQEAIKLFPSACGKFIERAAYKRVLLSMFSKDEQKRIDKELGKTFKVIENGPSFHITDISKCDGACQTYQGKIESIPLPKWWVNTQNVKIANTLTTIIDEVVYKTPGLEGLLDVMPDLECDSINIYSNLNVEVGISFYLEIDFRRGTIAHTDNPDMNQTVFMYFFPKEATTAATTTMKKKEDAMEVEPKMKRPAAENMKEEDGWETKSKKKKSVEVISVSSDTTSDDSDDPDDSEYVTEEEEEEIEPPVVKPKARRVVDSDDDSPSSEDDSGDSTYESEEDNSSSSEEEEDDDDESSDESEDEDDDEDDDDEDDEEEEEEEEEEDEESDFDSSDEAHELSEEQRKKELNDAVKTLDRLDLKQGNWNMNYRILYRRLRDSDIEESTSVPQLKKWKKHLQMCAGLKGIGRALRTGTPKWIQKINDRISELKKKKGK